MKQIGNSVVKLVLIPWRKLEPLQNDDLKTMTKGELEALIASLVARGITSALEVWDNKGRYKLLDGHQRLRAFPILEKRGYKVPPIPCLVVAAKSEKEAREILLSNVSQYAKVSDEGLYKYMHDTGMKFEQLQKEFVIPGVDLESFGASYFKDVAFTAKEAPDAEDEVPEIEPAKARAKVGQVYLLGAHRVMCGDSLDPAAVNLLTNMKTADLLFTDPPYGIDIVSRGGTVGAPGGMKSTHGESKSQIVKPRKYRKIAGDDRPFDPAILLRPELAEVRILWGANHYASRLPDRSHWIVWDKKCEKGADRNSFSDCELAWTDVNRKSTVVYRHLWSGLIRSGNRDEELMERVHPTQKPVGMCAEVIGDYSKEGATVLDLFGGSGSTLIACEKMKRRCLMMELEPAYVDVIIARWEKFTGEKAELLMEKKSRSAPPARVRPKDSARGPRSGSSTRTPAPAT